MKDFFGNAMTEKDSITTTLRNLRISLEALESQIKNGADPQEVTRQFQNLIQETKTTFTIEQLAEAATRGILSEQAQQKECFDTDTNRDDAAWVTARAEKIAERIAKS